MLDQYICSILVYLRTQRGWRTIWLCLGLSNSRFHVDRHLNVPAIRATCSACLIFSCSPNFSLKPKCLKHFFMQISQSVFFNLRNFANFFTFYTVGVTSVNPLNAQLNPICHLLALLGAHPILHVSRIRVNYTKISLL